MKKTALLWASLLATSTLMAQISLTGTSYSENFDNISSGLPAGWVLYTGGNSTSLGTNVSATNFVTAHTKWTLTSGNFRNCASADGFGSFYLADSVAQANATDRVLSVRQVGNTSTTFPGSDYAAFTLHIANTTSLSNFVGSFKLQSLDSTSPRLVTWQVEYALGATPSSFTVLSGVTGTMTTGGSTFSNNTINFNFGNALDNITSDVWIRIIPSTPSTGSGNRPTTGIDDFQMTWSGGGIPNYRPLITALSPADNSINVTPATPLAITFDRSVSKGTGNIILTNETDQLDHIIAVSDPSVTIAGNVVTISSITLALAKSYHVTFDSSAFDTAGYKSYGIYDTAIWNFSTPLPAITSLNENFDASCGATPSNLPAGWMKYSITGAQQWNCYSFGYNNTSCISMNGYQGGNNTNEDWLITPEINISALTNPSIIFNAFKKYAGDDIQVLVSNNYDGVNDPSSTSFVWNDLNIDFSTVDTNWHTYFGYLNSYKTSNMYIAFKYTSSVTEGAQWKLDNILITTESSVSNISRASLQFAVIGTASQNEMKLNFNVKEGKYTVSIYDLAGRNVYKEKVNLTSGVQQKIISGFNLSKGMYVVRLENGEEMGIAKAIVE